MSDTPAPAERGAHRRWAGLTALAVGLALACGAETGGATPDGVDDGPGSAGGESTAAPAADTVEVGMTNQLTFDPDSIQVRAGQTVRWTNTSVLVHTVTANPDSATTRGSVHLPDGAEPFHSGRLNPDETFTHTFSTPGRYVYFCMPHEGTKMRGTVVVTSGS